MDEIHVYVDGVFSDQTLCDTALVIDPGEFYKCNFSLNDDAKVVIVLDVSNEGTYVDLITMDNMNYEEWLKEEAFYAKENRTDYKTYGGTYGTDSYLSENQEYYVVVSNYKDWGKSD